MTMRLSISKILQKVCKTKHFDDTEIIQVIGVNYVMRTQKNKKKINKWTKTVTEAQNLNIGSNLMSTCAKLVTSLAYFHLKENISMPGEAKGIHPMCLLPPYERLSFYLFFQFLCLPQCNPIITDLQSHIQANLGQF